MKKLLIHLIKKMIINFRIKIIFAHYKSLSSISSKRWQTLEKMKTGIKLNASYVWTLLKKQWLQPVVLILCAMLATKRYFQVYFSWLEKIVQNAEKRSLRQILSFLWESLYSRQVLKYNFWFKHFHKEQYCWEWEKWKLWKCFSIEYKKGLVYLYKKCTYPFRAKIYIQQKKVWTNTA